MNITYPWKTVLIIRHLPGKHNQKDHASGAKGKAKQGTLFDKSKFVGKGKRVGSIGMTKEHKERLRELGEIKKIEKFFSDRDADDILSEFMYNNDIDDVKQVHSIIKHYAKRMGLDENDFDSGDVRNYLIAQQKMYEIGLPYASVVDFAEETYNYKDRKTGISTEVTMVGTDDYEEGIQVSGKVLNRSGETVGEFVRTVKDYEIHHDYFAMESTDQGSGFGARYYSALENRYLETGVVGVVTIDANIDVGGYAWARMGYDFANEYQREEFVSKFYTSYIRRYDEEPDWVPNTAYEIAAQVGPDGFAIGKDMLLGSRWDAYKQIDEFDPSWEAGERYYRAKGVYND